MNKPLSKNPRNLGVTIVSGSLMIFFGMFAAYFFTDAQAGNIFYGIVCVLLALVSLAVLVYGRKDALGHLAELIMSFV